MAKAIKTTTQVPVTTYRDEIIINLELTPEEAKGLYTLLYCGVHIGALEDLGIREISRALRTSGVNVNPNFAFVNTASGVLT